MLLLVGLLLVAAAAGSAAAAELLQRTHILQDRLLPPEHVISPDTWLMCSSKEDSSNEQDSFPASTSGQGLQELRSSRGPHQAGGRAAAAGGNGGDATSMATSLTGQITGCSSLLTTASSPDMRVQQALARIRQLQQRTQDALDKGGLQQLGEEQQASWA